MPYRFLTHSAILVAFVMVLTRGTSQAAVTPSSSNELSTLRQAYAALHAADHDYKGHRHKAMSAIRAACKAMGSAPEGDGKGHEPQATSDAQLKKAQQLLQGISGTTHVRVAKHVQRALSELSIALSIK